MPTSTPAAPAFARPHRTASGRRRMALAVLAAVSLVTAAGLPALSRAADRNERPVTYGTRTAVPQRGCQPSDRPETDLQGRVPPADLLTGRAARGYTCNLRVVGHLQTPTWGSLDMYGDCAYFSVAPGVGGVQVVDVSDRKNLRPTTVLRTPAMLDPWESLRINGRRGLLAAAGENKPFLDVYDVSTNCAYPRLLASKPLLPARGHEGWFAPDGKTYYMSTVRTAGGMEGLVPTLFPVDLTNPRNPKLLSSWTFDGQTHGGATTEDGARSYVCQQEAPPKDALLSLDTTNIAKRSSTRQPREVSATRLGDNQWCQGAYRVTYRGHPYLIQYGERSGAPDCSRADDNWANFGYPRIFDLADERHPKLVSTALLEVDLPQHCDEVTGEGAANGLGYSVHHCAPDRLYNPTILACSYFHAGLRVLDIRNPLRPVEIGYFNPGLNGLTGTASRPVIKASRGEIWMTNDLGGLYVLKFENGIWPFPKSKRCPGYADYWFKQYNPRSTCRTASYSGIGKPAPAGARYR